MRGLWKLGFLCLLVSRLSPASPRLFFNPISPLLGNANLGVDYAVGNRTSLGPELTFFDFRDGQAHLPGVGLGLQSEIYLARDVYTDSWVVAPHAAFFRLTKSKESINGFLLGASLAYAWFWPSGFNLKAGLGIDYDHADFAQLNFDVNSWSPGGTFAIGYYY